MYRLYYSRLCSMHRHNSCSRRSSTRQPLQQQQQQQQEEEEERLLAPAQLKPLLQVLPQLPAQKCHLPQQLLNSIILLI
jgi:hypothetical protein